MKVIYFLLVAFGVCNTIFSENMFLIKLESLLDYCLRNNENFDYGALLGISIAKQQLLSEPNEMYKNLIQKCDNLERKFFQKTHENFVRSNEIGIDNWKN